MLVVYPDVMLNKWTETINVLSRNFIWDLNIFLDMHSFCIFILSEYIKHTESHVYRRLWFCTGKK